jgi:exosortase E/protease (VPEID-CTERM system)
VVVFEADSTADGRGLQSRWALYGWLAAWLTLLIGEILALSLSFDTKTPAVLDHPSPLVRLLSHSALLVRLGMCIGVVLAMVLLGSSSFRRDLAGLLEQGCRPGPRWIWVVGQLAVYVSFYLVTHRLLQGLGQSTDQSPRVVAWASFGAATLACWGLAAMSAPAWLELLRLGWKVFLLGGLIGLIALLFGDTTGLFWDSFHSRTFQAAAAVLRLFSDRVIEDPATYELGRGDFSVSIGRPCSGFEGIGLIWAFLGGYLLLFRRELRFPQAFLLLPIGTVVIWAANVARIALLIIIGSWGYHEVALGGFHSQAGWLAFNAVGLGLVAASRKLNLFLRSDGSDARSFGESVDPTLAFLAPLLVIIATSMITGALSDGRFDRFYPARVLAAIAVLWFLRRGYTQSLFTWSWSAILVGALVFAAWILLEPTSGTSERDTVIPRALAGMSTVGCVLWLAARIFGSLVTVPVAEELAFRGFLLRRMIATDFEHVDPTRFTWPSFLTSSVLFGAMHQRWLAGTIAGMLYALAVLKNGRLGDAVLAHATTNALIAAYVVIAGCWSLWI